MRRLAASLLLSLAFAGAGAVLAQTTVDQAREEGKTMGKELRANDALVPGAGMAEEVPGYAGTDLPESAYFDDPDKLAADGGAQAAGNDAFATATDRNHTRATFDPNEILATTARATAIEGNPDTYLQGEQLGGSSGSCTPLPPGGGNISYYEATCNYGSKLEQTSQTCSSSLSVTVDKVTSYIYYTSTNGPYAKRSLFNAAVANGTCKSKGSFPYCTNVGMYGYTAAGSCRNTDYSPEILECTQEISGLTAATTGWPASFTGIVVATGKFWASMSETTLPPVITRNNGACAAAGDAQCTLQTGEVCTDSDPTTRVINGVPLTQPCWAWQTTYQCNTITQGNDCGDLDSNAQCTYVRDECIDDEEDPNYDPGACKVSQKVYRCPVPVTADPGPKQYVCGNDVYCVNGDCETIEREASTEFKDALVALHSLDQAGTEFNEDNFTVFSGTRETCHKPVFGLVNCCAGKVSGVLTAGVGAAAIAGGPTAIAALATPFLTMFLCSTEEKMLDIKDRMGFCHKVGTYCSSSILGVCQSKKTAYCCFESKLSRILQEQGRPQLNKPWGKPKKEQCEGFTIDEFSRLDLSVMDFTEVYSEFIDAAKLPDEVSTLADIQTKIQGYYDLHASQ